MHLDEEKTPLLEGQELASNEFTRWKGSRELPLTDSGFSASGYGSSCRSENEKETNKTSARTEQTGKFSRNQKLLLLNLSVGSLLAGSCIAIMIPFFPHEAKRRGLSQAITGAVFSCYALTQLVFFPIHGRLAPLVGVSRYYNFGLATAGVATLVFGLLPYIPDSTVFITASFITRSVEAMGTSAMHTAARTMIVNQFPDRTSTAMGVAETMVGVGLSLGPGIGGGLYYLGGYGAPFYTLGGLMLVASSFSIALMPLIAGPETPRQRYGQVLCLFLSAAENWLCCSVVFTVAINWTALDPNMEPYVNAVLNIGPAKLGVYFLLSATVYSVTSVLWGRIAECFHNKYYLILMCLAISGLGVMLIPPSPILGLTPSWWLLGVGMVLRELFQGGAYIPIMELMVRASVARGLEDSIPTQAFVASVFGAMFSLGNVLGPVAGGFITDLSGYPTVATCLGAVNVVICACIAARAVTLDYKKCTSIQQDHTSV